MSLTNIGAARALARSDRWMIVLVLLVLLGLLPGGIARAQSPADGFEPQTGWIEPVKTVAVQADGKVLIGGAFEVSGRVGLARLNADGSLDSAFQASADGTIFAVVAQADGHILVGGGFQHMNGTQRPGLVRLNADGSLDSAFNPQVTGTVFSIAEQSDGKLLIGGIFGQVGGQSRPNVARLNADGSLDTSFNPGYGPDSWVNSVAVQADGKLLVGGNFGGFNGLPRSRVARLNADGSVDASFNPGANGMVNSVVVQGNGKILIGGQFTQAGGQARSGVARLNADGSLDSPFNPNVAGTVRSVAVQADGKLLLGGDFDAVGGQARYNIARLNADGSLDSPFNPDADDTVNAVVAQADGKVVIGGDFTQVYGLPRVRIARLNADGSLGPGGALDFSFTPFHPAWYISEIKTMVAQPDGKVLFAGNFELFGGKEHTNLARANVDGTVDHTFNQAVTGEVYNIAVQSDGKILVAGDFSLAGGQSRFYIARLNADGSLDGAFNPQLNGYIDRVTVQPDGKLLIGGWFTQVNGQPRFHMARLNADGSLDSSFNPTWTDAGGFRNIVVQANGKLLVQGWFTWSGAPPYSTFARLNADGSLDSAFNPGANNYISSFAMQPDGKILISGQFTEVGGQPRTRMARLNADGSLDAGFNASVQQGVEFIVMQPDGKILIGGYMPQVNGQLRNHIARLNADGSLDNNFYPKPDWVVMDAVMQAGDKILISGAFKQINGQPRSMLARLNADGSLDAGDVLNPIYDPWINGFISPIALQPDGRVLLGGDFTEMGGQPHGRIARLNADSSLDATFNPVANDTVMSIAVQPDGKILVGGLFTQVNGQPRNSLARLNADGSLDSAFNPDVEYGVLAIETQPDGKILISGWFTQVDGQPRNYIARLNADGSLDSAFNANADSRVDVITVQRDGKILLGGYFTQMNGQPRNYIARLNADGSLDSAFNAAANQTVRGMALQPDGKILIGGSFTQMNGQPRISLARLNANGSLDSSFNPEWSQAGGINSLALQTDGRVLVNGSFAWGGGQPYSSLVRLNADGSRDISFAQYTKWGHSVTLQADGKVLMGTFSWIHGEEAHTIRRLYNTGTARQSLSHNPAGTSITWVRGGVGPEVQHVTFEVSADGQTYTPLGNGTYVDGGWHLDGITMPPGQGLFIRARGFYSSGRFSGSGSIVEMVKQVYLAGRGLQGATFQAPASAAEGSPFSLALRNQADPTNSHPWGPEFSYAFDCGYGYTVFGSSAGIGCATDDNGPRTVKGKIRYQEIDLVEFTAQVTVNNVAPTAGFNAPAVTEGSPINLALQNPVDAPADLLSLQYAFDCGSGYGSFSTSATATCPTTDNGTRSVKGKIKDKDNGTTEYTAVVTINNVAPTANFSAPAVVLEGKPIALTLQNPVDVPADRPSLQYAFDCGSGYGSLGTSATAICSTADNGTRSVKGKVKDKDGGVTEYTAQVTISNVAPSAAFLVPSMAITGHKFDLTLANVADAPGDLASLQYAFDCGDGAGYGAFGSNVGIGCISTSAGTRTVRGIVKDKDGATTEYSANVSVVDALTLTITAPRADDRLAVDQSIDFAATFTDQVGNTAHTCEISWDDGTPAEAGEVYEGMVSGTCISRHTYTAPGQYTIKVTVTNAYGDSSTADVTIVVEPSDK